MNYFLEGQAVTVNYAAFDQDESLNVSFFVYDITDYQDPIFIEEISATHAGNGVYFCAIDYFEASKIYVVIGQVQLSPGVPDPERSPSGQVFAPLKAINSEIAFCYPVFTQENDLDVSAFIESDEIVMNHVFAGVYVGSYDATPGENYLVRMSVMNESVIDDEYSPCVDSISSFYANFAFSNICQAILETETTETDLTAGPFTATLEIVC